MYQGQKDVHSQKFLGLFLALFLTVQQKQLKGQQIDPQVYSPKSHPKPALVVSTLTSVELIFPPKLELRKIVRNKKLNPFPILPRSE